MKRIIRNFLQAQVIRQKNLTASYLEKILNEDKLSCLDIGAACGLLEHWERIGEAGRYYHVEPHDESAAALENQFRSMPNHRIIKSAFSGKGGKRLLTITNSPTGSSILPFNEEVIKENVDPKYLDPRRSIEIETVKTSEALDLEGIERIDLIKLDVQGAEFEILEGLDKKRLDDLIAVELEINFHNVYIGQGSFSEIQSFLGKYSLELYDIRLARGFGLLDGKPVNPKVLGAFENSKSVSARVWEADIVFFKDYKILVRNQNTKALKRLIASFCVYGFFLDAIKVVHAMKLATLLGKVTADELESLLISMHSRTSARWFDRPNLVTRLLRRIANFCHVGPDWYRIQYSHVSLPNG